MAKDFDAWNKVKKQIDGNDAYFPLYQEREIRWCASGTNIGFEQDGTGSGGTRPVLILRGFSRRACLIVPLTTFNKSNPNNIPVGTIDEKEAAVIISQIRFIDTKRLGSHIAVLDKNTFNKIRKSVKGLL